MFRLSKSVMNLKLLTRCYSTEWRTLHGTLHMRFFEHLKETEHLNINSNLSLLLNIFESDRKKFNSAEYNSRATQIDRECMTLLFRKGASGVLYNHLDELIRTMPERILFMRFYTEAVRILLRSFERKPNEKHFVKLCFYLGLFKKKSPGPTLLTNLVDEYLDRFIDGLSTIDLAIVCTATYKASIRVDNKKFVKRLIQELQSVNPVDQHILIAFVKSLRLNNIDDGIVVSKLRTLRNNGELEKLDLTSLIHIFPLIADNFVKDDDLTEYLITRCMVTICDDVRAKDIQKLLYSCALLNFPIKLEHLQRLEKLVIARTEHNEYKQKFDNFVDVALSMWMLNFRSQPLVGLLLKDARFHKSGDLNRVKLDSRKHLLLTCVEIEEPEWAKDVVIDPASFNKNRLAPRYLTKETLQKTMSNLKATDAKIVQQIKNLNIAGILVKEGENEVHVEVLDQSNSLSDKKSPNGIFALKLRLLKHLGCEVKLVS